MKMWAYLISNWKIHRHHLVADLQKNGIASIELLMQFL